MKLLPYINIIFATISACTAHVEGQKSEKELKVNDSVDLSPENADLSRFKERNAVKMSSDVALQTISQNNTFTFHDVEYSLDDLEPYSILSPYFENDMEENTTSPLFRKVVGDTVLLVVMDGDRISHISIQNKQERGDILFVTTNETSTDPVYATVTNTDYDQEQLKASKSARSHNEWMKDGDKETVQVSNEAVALARSPKSADCTSSTTRVIEVAIAHDASFCKEFNGDKQRVNSHIQAIVALAAEYYEPVCISLRLSFIDGTCNSSNDPYKSMAKSKDILEEFTKEWREKMEGVRRDVAHLFSGTSFDRGILGWAWKSTVCSKANGYGANWLTFSENIALRASLFAHELGHNAGASHFGSKCTEWLMAPCGSGLSGFSEESLDSVMSFLDKQTCLNENRRPVINNPGHFFPPPSLNNNSNRPPFPNTRPSPIFSPTTNRPPFPAPIFSPPSVIINNNNRPPFLKPQTSPVFSPTTNRPPFPAPVLSPSNVSNGPPFLNPQPSPVFSPTTNRPPFPAPIFSPPSVIINNNNGPPFLNPQPSPVFPPTTNRPPFPAPVLSPTNISNRPPFLNPQPSPIFSSPTTPTVNNGNVSPSTIRKPEKYFEIRNDAAESFCLELKDDRGSENVKVTIDACNGNQMQKWGFNAKSRTIHSLALLDSKCMVPDVGNESAKRTRLIMQDCPKNIEEIESRPSLMLFQWGFSGGKIRNKGITSESYLEASRGVRRDGDVEEVVLIPTLSNPNGKDYQKWTRSFD